MCRGRFFTQRVVDAWRTLSVEVVEAGTFAMFKAYLDRHEKA